MFADYHELYGSRMEGAAKRIKDLIPSLVVVLARGSSQASVAYVDVIVGDTVRHMLMQERESEDAL